MRYSVHVPLGQIEGGFQSPDGVQRLAAAAEAAAVDAVNVTDHPAPEASWLHARGHDALDPFTALAFLAAASTRLLMHANIVVLPYRNPFLTAKAAATLQILSGGRLILGAAVGYQEAEFEALGVEFHRRGALSDEALDAIERIWSGGPVTIQGRHFEARNIESRPVPADRPKLWIGGGSVAAQSRAARYGDGWSPFLAGPNNSAANRATGIQSIADLRTKIELVESRRAELGRTNPFDYAIDLGGQHHPTDQTTAEAERFADLLGQLGEAGVSWTCVKPHAEDVIAFEDAIGWYGQEVFSRGVA